jgi:2-phospho-L-lactate guanylyltransferase (CobY/MobA/RfbA family)
MMSDVLAACRAANGGEVVVVREPVGQGQAIEGELGARRGPVTIVNSDLPCATPEELERLTAAAPAIVPAPDGTTNAIALRDASEFVALYGPGSADRFADALRADRLELPGLRDDVDTWDDLERVRDRVGRHTRTYLETHA